jgi:excisionase family DNA binding protein
MDTCDENTPDLQGYLTVNQAAERMGLSAETVRGLCRDGVLPDAVQERANGPWRIPMDAVKTWLQQKRSTSLQKRVWLAVGALATVAAIIGVFFAFPSSLEDILNLSDRWKAAHPTPTPLPFRPSKEGETLIVVASFVHTEGVADADIAHEIQRAVREAAQEVEATKVRVEVEPTRLSTDDRSGAETLGKRYNAGIAIWGADTGVRVTVNFLNLKQPDFRAADVRITETERTQLANPSAYASFVTSDLPAQLTFLALFAVGQSYFSEQAYENSIKVIERGVHAVPQGAKSPQGLADAYFRLGWLYQALNQRQQAIDSYAEVIALDPKSAYAYNNRGVARYDQGDLPAAIADYDQAIARDPQYAAAYNNRGNAHRDQGDLPAAIADYNHAIALDPKYAAAYNNRGLARAAQGAPQAAIADYDQAIALDPKLAAAYNNRGVAHTAQGDFPAAITDYDQAIALDPKLAAAYFNRGVAHGNQGDPQAAITDFDQAITLDPKLAAAYYNRGVAYGNQGDPQAAIADFDQAIALDPQDAKAYFGRGHARQNQGNLKAAIADFDQAIALDPKLAAAYNNRGNARGEQGNFAAAIADFDQAIALDPRNAAAYNNRGNAHKAQGDLETAIADYRRYLELQPNAPNRQQVELWITEHEKQ